MFRLFGYAGTGKTTLAKHLAEDTSKVLFGAYTGKAASVLREMGCSFAQTIHQLIYLPAEKCKQRLHDLQERYSEIAAEVPPEDRAEHSGLVRLKKLITAEQERLKKPAFTLNLDSIVRKANLVVVDECSMVNEWMGKDLLSFGTPVLVLGDPAQLPPVRGGGYFTDQKPDAMLDEIHRQARDNPIIEMATLVREGKELEIRNYGDSVVFRGKPPAELVIEADQVLVGANKTRRFCNAKMRKNKEPIPVAGDRLVCLRNDHEVGLLNGTIWEVRDVYGDGAWDTIELSVVDDSGMSLDVNAHTHYFTGREKDLPHWRIREAQCFDFGYALTTHKAQGSQWPHVFIFDESFIFRNHAKRWLYTAITRASHRVTINIRN